MWNKPVPDVFMVRSPNILEKGQVLVFAFCFCFAVLEQPALTEDSSKHNSLIYERSVLNQSLPTLASEPQPHTVNAGNRRHFPPFFRDHFCGK